MIIRYLEYDKVFLFNIDCKLLISIYPPDNGWSQELRFTFTNRSRSIDSHSTGYLSTLDNDINKELAAIDNILTKHDRDTLLSLYYLDYNSCRAWLLERFSCATHIHIKPTSRFHLLLTSCNWGSDNWGYNKNYYEEQ